MKVTPGLLALVTGAIFLGLVGVGVAYVVTADPRPTAAGGTAPTATAATTSSATTSSATASASAPSPTVPSPSAAPAPTAKAKAKPTRAPIKVPELTDLPLPTLDFTLTTFNVLGASHSRRRGVASGRVRAGRAVEILRRHDADVIGFQELQGSQLAVLNRKTNLDFYPGFSGDSENSIGWRRDAFEAVERRTVKIPYFNGGPRRMPFVKLRHIDSGLEAWFANFHNPADTYRFRGQQRFRNAATRIQIDLANSLVATGIPVFITGDMNERASYFCKLTGGSPMVAARGGSNNGRCLPGRPRVVDWIFGSQGVVFTDYFEDRSRLVDITTDHPVISARVRIEGKPLDLAPNS